MTLRSFLESHGVLELYLTNLYNSRPNYRVFVFLVRSGLHTELNDWLGIVHAFTWLDTPEGSQFWNKLDDLYNMTLLCDT